DGTPIDAVVIHWGWVTPGVAECNRQLQEEQYLAFLLQESSRGDTFNFTQPGWVLDDALSPALIALTAENPEQGKQGQPFPEETLASLRTALAQRQLSYLAYPYSGAIVEGMLGEAVLCAYRLTCQVVEKTLGVRPTGCFVHDGIVKLDWNCAMMPQIAQLAGFDHLFGRFNALIVSPDGSEFPMYGQPNGAIPLLYDVVELMDAPLQIATLRRQAKGRPIRFHATHGVAELLNAPEDRCSALDTRTKGWYGGAPLVMQMQAHLRRADWYLTTLATLLALQGQTADLTDLWKRSLILQDCHLQWLLHDLAPHYLPAARQHEEEVKQQLQHAAGTGNAWIFNPLAFPRDGVVQVDGQYRYVPHVPPFGSSPVTQVAAGQVSASTTTLRNNCIAVEVGSRGQLLSVADTAGHTQYFGAANQIKHWHNVPCSGEITLRTGDDWTGDGFCGNIRLRTEVIIPEDGEYTFHFEVPRGMTIALAREDGEWALATNCHWAGGMPSQQRDTEHTGNGRIALPRGRQRLCLSAVADRGFHLQAACLTLGQQVIPLQTWHGEKLLAWEDDPFVIEQVEANSAGARGTVVLNGGFSTCRAQLLLQLDEGQQRLDVRLTRHYDAPTFEGFQTLPLPLEVGSYLGSYCERPYLPAFAVETRVPYQTTRYTSDKPYGYSEAITTDEGWWTGRFCELYAGISPFLGIDTALAESPLGSVLLLTDGHN
ncbi:MAG TPA: hypothetical protein VGM23_01470, partial [Armatimonadota bacterium]